MNSQQHTTAPSLRRVMNALAVSVLALIVTSLMAQSPAPSKSSSPPKSSSSSPPPMLSPSPTPSPAPWPTATPYDAGICAFDKALTTAARDRAFRDRLLDSCDSAKQAIAEIGNLKIPCDRMIVFFEVEAGPGKRISDDQRKTLDAIYRGRSNERVHVFFLPPFNPNDTTTVYRYEGYFLGFYDAWKTTNPRCNVP